MNDNNIYVENVSLTRFSIENYPKVVVSAYSVQKAW